MLTPPAKRTPMIRLDRTFRKNPHDLYRRLRVETPAPRVVIWCGLPVCLITRYNAATALLRRLVLTALVDARDNGDQLAEDELLARPVCSLQSPSVELGRT
jgi:hypothetical protein